MLPVNGATLPNKALDAAQKPYPKGLSLSTPLRSFLNNGDPIPPKESILCCSCPLIASFPIGPLYSASSVGVPKPSDRSTECCQYLCHMSVSPSPSPLVRPTYTWPFGLKSKYNNAVIS